LEKEIPAVEKRLALFCLLAALILGGNLALQTWRQSSQEPAPAPNAPTAVADAANGDAANNAAANPNANSAADDSAADDSAGDDNGKPQVAAASTAATATDRPKDSPAKDSPAKDSPAKDSPASPPSTDAIAPRPPAVRKTLGSLDPSTGYRFLATFHSVGATVERIELLPDQYRELDENFGYLGHLGLTPASEGGARIGVVGPGTPAALAKSDNPAEPAGLLAGDLLESVDGVVVESNQALRQLLQKTKPGDSLPLRIRRDGRSRDYTARLGIPPLAVIRPEPQSDFEAAQSPTSSFLLTLDTLAQAGKSASVPFGAREFRQLPSLENATWEVVRADSSVVEFRYRLSADQLKAIEQTGELEVIKRYKLAAPAAEPAAAGNLLGFHLDLEVELRSTAPGDRRVSYRLHGPTGLPLEGWWYMSKSGTRDVVMQTDGGGQQWARAPELHSLAINEPEKPAKPLFSDSEPAASRAVRYLGCDANYFAVLLMPRPDAEGNAAVFRRASAYAVGEPTLVPKSHNRTMNTSFELVTEAVAVSPEKPRIDSYRIFAGPKDSDVLFAYDSEATEAKAYLGTSYLNDYGWFGAISRPLARVLHFYYDLVGNYGLAIVMLTLTVRSCLLPVSYRATKSAKQMQELQPELKKIAEKYKDEPQKRVQAQQQLFRDRNVSPFGGCLLALCQIPIFIGLYRCLSLDIELRGAPLLAGFEWCSNLSGPDLLLYWKEYLPGWLGDETGYLGPYINLLPLITIGLFLVNQKFLTPPATDEQTLMQQKVMKFMTVFMGVMFFKVASGLCVYFIASSCWSLAEHKILRRGSPAPGGSSPTPSPAPETPSSAATKKTETKAGKRRKR
jgi:YidC/Oxa1 family membrane protein insertase